MPENAGTDSQWSQSAPYWDKHRETIRRMFGPITDALVQDARIAAGFDVLDVATGPGEPALTIVDVVGSSGSVWGIDPAPEMIAAARRAADSRSLKNAHFEVSFADHLPFSTGKFD